ncbi:hypothetical protein P4S72_27855 [Vibrio sp. PP-XX7]
MVSGILHQKPPAQNEASTALYHYTQSLIPDVCLLEYQNLTLWFAELTQWLAKRHIQLERHSEIQSIENVAFYAQPLLQTLTQLLPHFVSGKNDVLVMEPSYRGTLTSWQLTNRCYLNDKARDNYLCSRALRRRLGCIDASAPAKSHHLTSPRSTQYAKAPRCNNRDQSPQLH